MRNIFIPSVGEFDEFEKLEPEKSVESVEPEKSEPLISDEQRKLDDEQRLKNRLYNYGMTPEQYFKMLSDQNDMCAICKVPFNNMVKPVIDHDHKTGKVRGLLCAKCNYLLGVADDSVTILDQSISYLLRSKLGISPI